MEELVRMEKVLTLVTVKKDSKEIPVKKVISFFIHYSFMKNSFHWIYY